MTQLSSCPAPPFVKPAFSSRRNAPLSHSLHRPVSRVVVVHFAVVPVAMEHPTYWVVVTSSVSKLELTPNKSRLCFCRPMMGIYVGQDYLKPNIDIMDVHVLSMMFDDISFIFQSNRFGLPLFYLLGT